MTQVLPGAVWQRCYVHSLRNALDHLPRKHDDDCMTELRWIYDRRKLAEADTHGRPQSGRRHARSARRPIV